MDLTPALPAPTTRPGQLASLIDLAAIPEEEVWLASQKSARTRRAYKLDVAHFMRTLGIPTPDQLRQVDHGAVIVPHDRMTESASLAGLPASFSISAVQPDETDAEASSMAQAPAKTVSV